MNDEDQIAEYDALHDGVPEWMESAFWAWVRKALTVRMRSEMYSEDFANMLDGNLAEQMCQRLRIALPNVRTDRISVASGIGQFKSALAALHRAPSALQIADYLLAHGGHAKPQELDGILERSKSAWMVGDRAGRSGLVRRVPLGVQTAVDATMARAGRAGVRLAKAWEELYGLTPNPSEAYRLAIQAVEDAAVPVVSPSDASATLGKVIGQLAAQGSAWSLPMDRQDPKAPASDVLVGMMRMLWHGQHDRHGGQPSAPGNVSQEEATVAVGLAVTLVQWFDAGLVQRRP